MASRTALSGRGVGDAPGSACTALTMAGSACDPSGDPAGRSGGRRGGWEARSTRSAASPWERRSPSGTRTRRAPPSAADRGSCCRRARGARSRSHPPPSSRSSRAMSPRERTTRPEGGRPLLDGHRHDQALPPHRLEHALKARVAAGREVVAYVLRRGDPERAERELRGAPCGLHVAEALLGVHAGRHRRARSQSFWPPRRPATMMTPWVIRRSSI